MSITNEEIDRFVIFANKERLYNYRGLQTAERATTCSADNSSILKAAILRFKDSTPQLFPRGCLEAGRKTRQGTVNMSECPAIVQPP